MRIQKNVFIVILFLCTQSIYTISLKEQFSEVGYLEICDNDHSIATYDCLYACFDELITFFQKNPTWAQKLYSAKERFIRSENRHYYSTDFFGFYDESEREGRSQISFYYSTHFQDFLFSHYQEFKQVSQIVTFFASCRAIEQSSRQIFDEAAAQLGLENIFFSQCGHPTTLKLSTSPRLLWTQRRTGPPILLKIVKYLPSYSPARPHYDGTALSLFLDSTDNQSLLLSSYKSVFTVDDFSSPIRQFARSYNQNSIVLIPGTLLTEFSIYPTPHIVERSGKVRYATIAFAMRPHYTLQKNNFSHLPTFKY